MNQPNRNTIRGVLTQAQYWAKSETERRRLLAEGWLVAPAGGAPDDDDDKDDKSKSKSKKKGEDDEEDEGEEGDDEKTVTISKKDYDGMQSTIGSLRRSVKKLEDAAEEAEDAKSKDEGKFEDLYEKEKSKNEKLTAENTELKKGGTARAIAAKLNFHNPDRAVGMLDLSELESPADFERALKDLAKSDSYLVNPKKRQSGKVGDDDKTSTDTDTGDDSDNGGGTKDRSADKRSPDQKMAAAYESNSSAQE